MKLAKRVVLLALPNLMLVSGCALKTEENYDKMRGMLTSGKYTDAVNFIEGKKESFYGETNAVLFYLDRLMALHLAKRYQDSNQVVDQASKKIDELYTKSVTGEVGAFLTSDNTLPYEGEDFEKVLIHVVGALNYTFMGDRDGALVEARRVEQKLTVLNARHTKDGNKNEYSEDAFVRWLIGCLYETEGDDQGLNDAVIAYKKAIEAYEKSYTPKYRTGMPKLLVQDVLRAADKLHFQEDFDAIKKKFPGVTFSTFSETKDLGEVVFMHLNGEAPYKIEKHWEAVADKKVIKVAYPEYREKPKRIAYATVTVAGVSVQTEMMEDVNAIAIQTLKDHMGRVKGKMVARAITKFIAAKATEVAASKASGNSGFGALMGLGASVAGAATEQADKRSWLLLPSSIDVAKTFVTPGTHTLVVTFHSASGSVIGSQEVPNVEIKPGKKTFLSYRSF